MIALHSLRRACWYETTRLLTRRSTLGMVGLAVFGAALITLPAARAAVTSGEPQGRVAWVVAGGALGAAVPGTVAVVAGAWLGAGLVSEDYRYGLGLSTLTRLPRRGSGLVAKVGVAAFVGLLLAFVTRAAAFFTALGGFALAHSTAATGAVSPGYWLVLPSIAELFFGMLGGVIGVLTAPAVRFRVLAVAAAWGLSLLIAAITPHSHSPYTPRALRWIEHAGLPVAPTVLALPGVVLLVLTVAALLTVRRRTVD